MDYSKEYKELVIDIDNTLKSWQESVKFIKQLQEKLDNLSNQDEKDLVTMKIVRMQDFMENHKV